MDNAHFNEKYRFSIAQIQGKRLGVTPTPPALQGRKYKKNGYRSYRKTINCSGKDNTSIMHTLTKSTDFLQRKFRGKG